MTYACRSPASSSRSVRPNMLACSYDGNGTGKGMKRSETQHFLRNPFHLGLFRLQAYVEKLKEQALARMPKNPPPPALAMHADTGRPRQGPPAATIGRPNLPQLPLAPPAPPRRSLGSLYAREKQPLLEAASSSETPQAAAAASRSPYVPRHSESEPEDVV